jgi:hypothetical protein
MYAKSSVLLVYSLFLVAAMTTATVPTVRNQDTGTATISSQTKADQPASAPIVVAQGRCFNGKCY